MTMQDRQFSNDERNALSRSITKHPRWRVYAKANQINSGDLRKTAVMKAALQALNIKVEAVLADAAGDAIASVAAQAVDTDTDSAVADTDSAAADDSPEALLARALAAMKVKAASEADHATLDRGAVEQIVADYIAKNGTGPVKTVVIDAVKDVRKDVGTQHKQFATLLQLAQLRLNIFVPGPAGSGKSHAARSVAQALDLPFYAHGAMEMRHELLGHVNQVTNEYISQPFVEAFRDGGVVCLDEIDSWDTNATLALNGALADGFVFLPNGERVERHADCVIICGANTLGQGADSRYVGRNKLDAAFLDRFVYLPWDYDYNLEAAICGNKDVVKKMIEMRAAADSYGLDCVISPRASVAISKLVANGFDLDSAVKIAVLNKLPVDQWDIFGY